MSIRSWLRLLLCSLIALALMTWVSPRPATAQAGGEDEQDPSLAFYSPDIDDADLSLDAARERRGVDVVGFFASSQPGVRTYTWQPDELTWDPILREFVSKQPPIREVGPFYYRFYYTGTINSNGTVDYDPENPIRRIWFTQSDWLRAERYIVYKLMYYYSVTFNLPIPAQIDVRSDVLAEASGDSRQVGVVPGGGGGGFAGVPPAQQQMAQQIAGQVGQSEFVQQYAAGGNQLDIRSAAEWTFYYDQLVLWQHYCAYTLLHDFQAELVDEVQSLDPDGQLDWLERWDEEAPPSFTERPEGINIDVMLITPEEDLPALDETTDPQDEDDLPDFNAVRDYSLQQVYWAMTDPRIPPPNFRYRDVFIRAARENEAVFVNAYESMIERLKTREEKRERYDEWVQERRDEVRDFAQTWRSIEEGESILLDETLFLITDEPLQDQPPGSINLLRSENVTPQDLLNPDGSIRRPIRE